MNVDDLRQEFTNAAARAGNLNAINDWQNIFREFKSELEQLEAGKKIDADDVRYLRRVLALRGLEVTQKIIPALDRLSREILEAAGREAVRSACAPRQMTEDDGNGKQRVIREVASEYSLPTEFA